MRLTLCFMLGLTLRFVNLKKPVWTNYKLQKLVIRSFSCMWRAQSRMAHSSVVEWQVIVELLTLIYQKIHKDETVG